MKKRNRDKEDCSKVIRKPAHLDTENIRNEICRRTLTFTNPSFNGAHSQKPLCYRILATCQEPAVVNLVICNEEAQLDQVFDPEGDSQAQKRLTRRCLRDASQAVLRILASVGAHKLDECLKHSALPLRLLNTSRRMQDSWSWSNSDIWFSPMQHEMTASKRKSIIKRSSQVYCACKVQKSIAGPANSLYSKRSQTEARDIVIILDDAPFWCRLKDGTKRRQRLSFDQTSNSEADEDDNETLKWDFSPARSTKFTTITGTQNGIRNELPTIVSLCYSNKQGHRGYELSCDTIMETHMKKGDNKYKITDKKSSTNKDVERESNGNSKNWSVNRKENSNNSNESKHNATEDDGSSDSDIDCEYGAGDDSCKSKGQEPVSSNALSPADYLIDAENIHSELIGSVNKCGQQVAMDSPGNSTLNQMGHREVTSYASMATNKETLNKRMLANKETLNNSMLNIAETLNNSISTNKETTDIKRLYTISVQDRSQQSACPKITLTEVSCGANQACRAQSPKNKLHLLEQAKMEAGAESNTQNSHGQENCPNMIVSKGANAQQADSSVIQVSQVKAEDHPTEKNKLFAEAQKRSDNDDERYAATTVMNELSLGRECEEDFQTISPTTAGNAPSSQTDFTKNNEAYQSLSIDKVAVYESLKSTDITVETNRTSPEVYGESEVLKCWEGSVHTRKTEQGTLNDLRCVQFLSILTTKLEEYSNKGTPLISSPVCLTSLANDSGNIQPSITLPDKSLSSSTSPTADDMSTSFCYSTDTNVGVSHPHTSVPKRQAEDPNTKTTLTTTEHNADGVLRQSAKTAANSKKQTHLSAKQTKQSVLNVAQKKVRSTSKPETSPGRTQSLPLEVASSYQEANVDDLCEEWSTKYTMSLSDQFLQKCDLITLTCKEKEKKAADLHQTGNVGFKRGAIYDSVDPCFEVDIFKSVEYVTSLSCDGQVNDNACYGSTAFEQTGFKREFHDLTLPHLRDNSGKICGFSGVSEVEPTELMKEQNTSSAAMFNENLFCQSSEGEDEEAANYSKARMMRASERRRKLMTEFEEITSCAEVFTWTRYDNRNFCSETRTCGHELEHSLSKHVTDLDSTGDSEGKHIIGTFTIEHLKPPVKGVVVLK